MFYDDGKSRRSRGVRSDRECAFKRRHLHAIGKTKVWRKPVRLASPERLSGPNRVQWSSRQEPDSPSTGEVGGEYCRGPPIFSACVGGMSYQGNSLLISWMKRPWGLSDPSSATATVVFAPSGTDIGAASEPRAVLTQPGCTEFTLMLVSLSSSAKWIVNMLTAAFDAL